MEREKIEITPTVAKRFVHITTKPAVNLSTGNLTGDWFCYLNETNEEIGMVLAPVGNEPPLFFPADDKKFNAAVLQEIIQFMSLTR